MYVLVLDHDKWHGILGYTRGAWMVYGCATSKNFGKVRGRRHTFRLLSKTGKIRYRGYCVFPDHADYGALLRPLIDFGCKHGCYQIAYKVGRHYNKIPLESAFRFSKLCGISASTREFIDFYDLRDLSEADAEQLENYMNYVTEV